MKGRGKDWEKIGGVTRRKRVKEKESWDSGKSEEKVKRKVKSRMKKELKEGKMFKERWNWEEKEAKESKEGKRYNKERR